MHGQSGSRATATLSRAEEGSRREAEAQDKHGNAKTRKTKEQEGEVGFLGKILAEAVSAVPARALPGQPSRCQRSKPPLSPWVPTPQTTLEPRLGRHLCGGMQIFVKIINMRSDEDQKTTTLGGILAEVIHKTPGKRLAGDDCNATARPLPGPQQDPCRRHQRSHCQARASQDSTAIPKQLLAQPAGQAPAWRWVASTPTQQAPAWWHATLREGSTTAPAQQPANVAPRRLVSSDACQGQARRRQLGRASLPSPIKQGGHVGSTLNAFVRRSQRIGLSTVDLSTSCVPLWQPLFSIKGGPRCPGEGFGSLGLCTHRS